ncbi:hypothetical protein DXA97_06115 [Clostridium sp. OF09-36]|uniref:hypothetical protein n=1 Tax=Clostridium sp. OF09-36 TaxID=2292310 RepID=UPI000E49BE72|nr:hypothetical protein [Clostridium sp. OF09-36]RHV88738.1 hypothetical protein DXA97_06115 [Clostridium sp. OF09-36]
MIVSTEIPASLQTEKRIRLEYETLQKNHSPDLWGTPFDLYWNRVVLGALNKQGSSSPQDKTGQESSAQAGADQGKEESNSDKNNGTSGQQNGLDETKEGTERSESGIGEYDQESEEARQARLEKERQKCWRNTGGSGAGIGNHLGRERKRKRRNLMSRRPDAGFGPSLYEFHYP